MRRKTKKTEERQEGQERWLLTYSDMITLLLGLFIVMYSISTVDQAKLHKVANMIRGGFGLPGLGESLVLDGSSGLTDDNILIPRSAFYRFWERFSYSLKKLREQGRVFIGLSNREEINLVLYLSSLAEEEPNLTEEAEETFRKLSEMSQQIDMEIVLSVHIPQKDSVAKGKTLPKWDYYAGRASKYAKYISDRFAIPPEKISIQASSEFRKAKDLQLKGESPEDIARQERIEILIRKRGLDK